MVNTGKPSGGCELCRKRRVKCDERKPACAYCQKKQITCRYPKSQFEVAWRDQNQVASKAVQRRLNARAKANPDTDCSSRELVQRHSSDVPRVLPQNHEHYAQAFFFNYYVVPLALSSHERGFLGSLLPFWTRAIPSSPLRPAVNAVAQTLLEVWSFSNPNSSQSLARPYYLQGILAVRRHLESAEDVDDDVLWAMLMLDMYDRIQAFCGGRPHESTHVKGCVATIENQRRLPVSSRTSQGTLLGVRSRFIDDALNKKEPVPSHVLTWATKYQSSRRIPDIELEAINVEVANLQVSALGLTADTEGLNVSVLELLGKARELDMRLVAWTTIMPDEWAPMIIWDPETIPRSVRDAGLYQNHCSIHQSIWTADILNLHCISRIKTRLVILACLEHLNDLVFDMTRTNALTSVQDLADTICASVPYHLGDRVEPRRIDDRHVQYPCVGDSGTPDMHCTMAAAYGGVLLTKRLAELLKLGPLLRPGQQQWILSQMGRIKKIYTF
ncbi:MAG: hypothetical protein Q9197_002808 [Variospora fuerteventurae]